jgi:thiol-disulfide isomerase/thioredoxin
LSFWFSACPPCRALIPHEKALLQRYRDRPFVLLGVNTDDTPEQLRQFQQQAGMTWPCWWDGPGGKIVAAWRVDRFPALFLIDHRGVVCWRCFGPPREGELEARIDECLARAQAK